MNHLVSPSLLAADFLNLGKDVRMVNLSLADWIHCDIMDGLFVPNISFGLPVIEHISKIAEKPLDVHLMIVDPDRYLSRFRDAGASILTVQYEACTHLNRTVSEIRRLGMKAGVAINPHTPVTLLQNILPYIDMVLIMTVNPGFGGQSFIPESYNKIRELSDMIAKGGFSVMIQVDGGVDTKNAQTLVEAGVNVLVAGNAVFSSPDPEGTIRKLKLFT
ncbi:MAG: ribulose-phosphate 3-epimerase [Bacteroidales bacterium]|jgi:ribulose-phosphate 3-epimerase|nr:ribulose-phosphate 3-epimerase [Bacteroidales bacterium]